MGGGVGGGGRGVLVVGVQGFVIGSGGWGGGGGDYHGGQ